MKLIIQIPCFNEAQTLPMTLRELPRRVTGFDCVEWLVIDDGSIDGTSEVARACGADHVIRHHRNAGLARAFMSGLEECLRLGADVIVNTDADNQYVSDCIPELVQPIIEGHASIVVGSRPISQMQEFTAAKIVLQKIGSWVVRFVSSTDVPDAPSGFRAFHRDAAARLYVHGKYTYTLETIIQAGRQGFAIASVPVRVNAPSRPSRLIRSVPYYVWRSSLDIVRIFVLYKPLRFFVFLGMTAFVPGFLLGVRFLIAYIADDRAGHIQSLILAAILLIGAGSLWVVGVLSDLIAANRVLLEDIRHRLISANAAQSRDNAAQTYAQDKGNE